MAHPNANAPIAPVEIGQKIFGRYEILEKIAAGAHGEVYRARQLKPERHVAIKVLSLDSQPPACRVEMRARFEREMQLIGQLENPHVVKLFDCGIDRGRPVMILELINGQTLQQRLRDGPLTPSQTFQLISQVLQVVIEAHSKGILHRDLKPSNIMLVETARRYNAKVLDFGIARVLESHRRDELRTELRAFIGTPGYMAPEQFSMLPTTGPGCDIYALGLIMFEGLTV